MRKFNSVQMRNVRAEEEVDRLGVYCAVTGTALCITNELNQVVGYNYVLFSCQ
jgi:hypothetical protein